MRVEALKTRKGLQSQNPHTGTAANADTRGRHQRISGPIPRTRSEDARRLGREDRFGMRKAEDRSVREQAVRDVRERERRNARGVREITPPGPENVLLVDQVDWLMCWQPWELVPDA